MFMKATLYYVHDPMCSWCWGFSRTFNELLNNLPKEVEVHRLLGGLAADSDTPMPLNMQEHIKSNWLRIEDTISGVKFNFDFWRKNIPRRSTYPACRAVIAARLQGDSYDVKMTKVIQQAYYQEARNPSDNSTLIELAKDLNIDSDKFEGDLNSNKVQETLSSEIYLARELFAESFPSLLLSIGDEIYPIPLDYNNYKPILDAINIKLKEN